MTVPFDDRKLTLKQKEIEAFSAMLNWAHEDLELQREAGMMEGDEYVENSVLLRVLDRAWERYYYDFVRDT